MKKAILFLFLFILCISAISTNYYVSDNTGNDTNDGLSISTAFKTIQTAADLTLPGDTVFVLNGTYVNPDPDGNVVTIKRSGTFSDWIVYTNYPNHNPLISFDGWQGFQVVDGAGYIEINGFVIQGNRANVTLEEALNQPGGCNNPNGNIDPKYCGNGIQTHGLSSFSLGYPHHIRIANNLIYDCCGAGISSTQSDYLTIENNTIYNNGWYTLFGSSGIVLWQNWNYDNNLTDYRMIIQNNRLFGNMNFVPWIGVCEITDGNGIIIDDSKNTQNGSTIGEYNGRTLITNNLVYGSGGAGIHVYLSEHVDIINNTTYFNQQTPQILNGEIDASSSSDIIIRNNIMSAKTNKPINTSYDNNEITHDYNLYFGGNGTSVVGNNTIYSDPLFINPTLDIDANFQVSYLSQVVDNGTNQLAPNIDFNGDIRPQGNGYDIGAYESEFTSNINESGSSSNLELEIYPNPASKLITIKFYLSTFSNSVSLDILDLYGNNFVNLPIEKCKTGENSFIIDISNLSAGTYFIRLKSLDKIAIGKLVIMK